ncbi:ABC transporter substrate-binding protein [uncultured Sulfitobacter sp.]|uniref:ABC transporter substrate-binding protein n=1 Tax=uncultured Sulfitobacter sp. TaxID=191468 RepID=UPI00260AB5BB|nr:ABC transporter substrate-binding protein [uncultured Sulfitobacter sp.]
MTRRPPIDRRALFASGAAAALLAAAGVSAGPLPQRGGKLRLAVSGALRSDSWQAGSGLFMQVARQGLVFETLTEVAADGTLRGELAANWTGSPDGRVWEFDLRKDAVFHDNAQFTSADVVQCLEMNAVITALDTHRVRFELAIPDASFPFKLSDPAHVIRPAHAPQSGIGTGLYRVVHFAPGQQLIAKRVPRHPKDGQAGWFDQVELASIPSEEVRAQALAEYLVDGADLADPSMLRTFDDIVTHQAHAVSRSIATPMVIGTQRPLDNLRAAQRWWAA